MGWSSLPMLAIPAQSSPASTTYRSSTPNGRPSTWSSSAQRKMARLYLYTTLPMVKILEIVNAQSPDRTIGPGTASKRLQSLLDKQPRWLHPTDEDDMDRRVTQLANSPTRLGRPPDTVFDDAVYQPQEASLPSFTYSNTRRTSWIGSMGLGVPPQSENPVLAHQHVHPRNRASAFFPVMPQSHAAEASIDGVRSRNTSGETEGTFNSFLRRTTFMSSSTSGTTGSFQDNLQGYSEPYVAVVRRLVKRFTTPGLTRQSMSPAIDDISMSQHWLLDEDAPEPFGVQPYPLPGHFLSLDIMAQHGFCDPGTAMHHKRQCLCIAQRTIVESPWSTVNGLTQNAENLLRQDVTIADASQCDQFGNTVLHFLAARAPTQTLLRAIETNITDRFLNARNSADQTFLHVISRSWMNNHNALFQLLNILESKRFDIYACDIYGRNVFHILRLGGFDIQALDYILHHYNHRMYGKRDAFDIVPRPLLGHQEEGRTASQRFQLTELDSSQDDSYPALRPESSNDPALSTESQLLQNVRWSLDNPLLEDENGRNGLHCLAMATLSLRNVVARYNLSDDLPLSELQDNQTQPDSSEERLRLRLHLMLNLLNAGVDPNHRDKYGNTPLMTFAAELPEDDDYKAGPEILKLLVDRGAHVDARNKAGETALHIAARCHRKLAVRSLVGQGANVHVRDASGRSVLEVIDVKMKALRDGDPRECARFEACRAYLSGSGGALQDPTLLKEWGVRRIIQGNRLP